LKKKHYLIIAGISGALAVAFGAFGAHTFNDMLSKKMLDIFKTGTHYHLIHSVVLLSLAFYDKMEIKIPFILISTGIFLFSFSLYTYALSGVGFIVFFTPIGGLFLIAGWLSIVWSAIKAN